jgi:hypothetical protein
MSFILKFDFESLIQNIFRILKFALKQSCRELNFEQLLFWGRLVKMSFSSFKFWIWISLEKSRNLFS